MGGQKRVGRGHGSQIGNRYVEEQERGLEHQVNGNIQLPSVGVSLGSPREDSGSQYG